MEETPAMRAGSGDRKCGNQAMSVESFIPGNQMANTSIKLRKRLLRVLRRLLITMAVIYVGACGALYFVQDWIEFPGAKEQGTAQSKITFGTVVHLATSKGIPIEAVLSVADQPNPPTILYFYGNAGAVAWSDWEFDQFRKMGCNVLIPDLAGYGASGGKPSEENFYATADAAWDYLQHVPGIDPKKSSQLDGPWVQLLRLIWPAENQLWVSPSSMRSRRWVKWRIRSHHGHRRHGC